MATEEFEKFAVIACDSKGLPPSFIDSSVPVVIDAKAVVDELLTKPVMQQVLTGFGGRYKKLAGFKEEGKVTNTLAVKQGKEDTEAFFSKMFKQLKQPLSLTQVSSVWNTTSWIWGYQATTYMNVGQTPNGASMFKIQVLGEVDTWVINIASLKKALDELGTAYTGMDSLLKIITDMDAGAFSKLKETGLKVYYHKSTADTFSWAPAGSIVAEKAGDSPLIYGLRKSVFFDSADSKASFGCFVEMMRKGGSDVSKFETVLQLFTA